MYQRDVQCSDCHDVHSAKPVLEDNALCLQCHRAAQYDSYEHHFHKREGEPGEPIRGPDDEVLFEVGTGASCEQCHMPGRYYMVVDYRPDHSFRIPDPALAAAVGAPDACLRCHVDQDPNWSQQTLVEWYGPGRRAHYGRVLAAGRSGDPAAAGDLAGLAADALYPANVRATALSLLAAYPPGQSRQAVETALQDEEALLRRTALSLWQPAEPREATRLIAPLLYDPVRSVRIEAARRLAGEGGEAIYPEQRARRERVLQEFEDAMWYTADFASSRHNLGNLFAEYGDTEGAIHEYREALRIDSRFYPAAANLAILYSMQGRNDDAEAVLLSALDAEPEAWDLAYSLGLLYAELKRYREAARYLQQAAGGQPGQPRIRYNLGLLYLQLEDLAGAERELRAALELDPDSLEFQYGLASFYLNQGRFEDARPIAEAMAAGHPDNPVGSRMLEFIRDRLRP
jgi:tetratricopeptide (TPR) repeat protein